MPSLAAIPFHAACDLLGGLGRWTHKLPQGTLDVLGWTGAAWKLLVASTYCTTLGVIKGKTHLRASLFPIMTSVGVRSLIIVSLVAALMGAVLVLQTGDVLKSYGQISQAPGLVALSMTRELGPLMTMIVLTARVGASYTAVLGSMNINEEIDALKTMAIDPVGYLVAPRIISMLIMAPALTVFAYIFGMSGGALVGSSVYDITLTQYLRTSFEYLSMPDLLGGLLKALVFGLLVSLISCRFGLTAKGGPTGLGRYIMMSVVTCIVVVAIADAILTAFILNHLL